MTYIMSAKMYWNFIDGGKEKMTHQEVIEYVNSAFGLRGTVVAVQISAE